MKTKLFTKQAKRPRIAIIGHGGTIGMEEVLSSDSSFVRIPAKSAEELLMYTSNQTKQSALFKLIQFENEDSTNLNPYHWKKLARKIKSLQSQGKTDAVIVTHGTDTMAHHAGAIALAFVRNLRIPVIFTGAQKPIGQAGSDALNNLEESILTACSAVRKNLCEVMIVFNHKIFLAVRTIKRNESRFDAFDSPAFPTLGDFNGNGLIWSSIAPHMSSGINKRKRIKQHSILPEFSFKIVTVELSPGLDADFLRAIVATGKCKGLILKSFGAGNVPNRDYSYISEKTNLIPFIKEATTRFKIPVIVTTQYTEGNTYIDKYEPGKAALGAGAIAIEDMTHVMAQVKLMWLVAQPKYQTLEAIRAGMLKNFVGEISGIRTKNKPNIASRLPLYSLNN